MNLQKHHDADEGCFVRIMAVCGAFALCLVGTALIQIILELLGG